MPSEDNVKKSDKEISKKDSTEQDNTLKILAEIIYEQYISDMKKKRESKKNTDISSTISKSKSNRDNPKIGKEFEELTKSALEIRFKTKFSQKAIRIGNPPKIHFFDLISEDGSIIVECKNYSWTTSGNVPSAKCATLNEAVLYLSKTSGNAKRIIVLRRSFNKTKNESLAEYYSRTYEHLLENIFIMELDTDKMILRNIKGEI